MSRSIRKMRTPWVAVVAARVRRHSAAGAARAIDAVPGRDGFGLEPEA